MKITHCERSTRRLSPSVSVALSRMPSSSCQRASEAFSISSNSRMRELQLLGMPLVQRLLRKQRMGFAVSEVSGGRADQLGDFVRVLELGAIDLDQGARIAEQALRPGLDHAGFARTGGPEKQQVPNRTVRRIQPRQEHLVDLSDFFDGGVLTDDCDGERLRIPARRCCGATDQVRYLDQFSYFWPAFVFQGRLRKNQSCVLRWNAEPLSCKS